MGVKFETNCIVGKDYLTGRSPGRRIQWYFVGSGAGYNFMGFGENLIGIMSCNEYLTRVNLMQAADPESDTPVYKGKRSR